MSTDNILVLLLHSSLKKNLASSMGVQYNLNTFGIFGPPCRAKNRAVNTFTYQT